jgi:hypothetical protein
VKGTDERNAESQLAQERLLEQLRSREVHESLVEESGQLAA